MPPRPRFNNTSRPSSHHGRSRINLLQDARHLTIRARNLGMDGFLPWQHDIERLLRRERRGVARGNETEGGSMAEEDGREAPEIVQGLQTQATGAVIGEIDIGSARREVVGDEAEAERSSRAGPRSFDPTAPSMTTPPEEMTRESQATRHTVDDSMLEMGALVEMVRVLDAAAPPALLPSALETMALFTAGASIEAMSPLRSPRSVWPAESETREIEARETDARESEVLQTERWGTVGYLMGPAPTPSWTGERSPISSTGAAAGSSLRDMPSESNMTEKGPMAFTRARREEMMRQMAADISNYSEGRERTFEAENGYSVYSPIDSEGELVQVDDENSSWRSFAPSPNLNLPRRRSRLDRVNPLVRNDAILRDPTEDFHNYLRVNRQTAEVAIIQRRTVADVLIESLQPSGGELLQLLETTIFVNGRAIQNIPDQLIEGIAEATAGLRPQERSMITTAIEDGLGLLEASVLTEMWQAFLESWREPLLDVALFEIPYRTRMFWYALSGGWGSWMPSGFMLRYIGTLFETITGRQE